MDGNTIEEVYTSIKNIANKIRNKPKPYLVECKTFRVRGHEEASGVKYVPKELIEQWTLKDPILRFENKLMKKGILDQDVKENIKNQFKEIIERN